MDRDERLLITNIAMLHLIKYLSDDIGENTNRLGRKKRWKRVAIAYLNRYLSFELQFKQMVLDEKGEIKNRYNLFNSEIIHKLLRKMDEIHDLIDAESETSLLNGNTISKSLISKIHFDIVYSSEMKYFCRIHTPHIIVEGPDRSGKSTLIYQLNSFFNSRKRMMYNIVTEINHVTLNTKLKNEMFLDLSTQEDRLLFQNNLFNRVSRNIYNRHRFPIYYEQVILMDRSLLSNLIYSYVMLDKEHFKKYLFSNYRILEENGVRERKEDILNFTFIEPNGIEFNDNNFDIISSNYTKTEFKTNNPFYNENDILDLTNSFNDGMASSYTALNNSKTSTAILTLYERMNEYVLKILYIKNTVYSFNKLDEIEKNVKQNKIVDLYSLFKDLKDISELKNTVINEECDTYKYSYDLGLLMAQNIKASFDVNKQRSYDRISIIYDDNKDRSAIETFDNCIEKMIEINNKMYFDEITDKGVPIDEPDDCCYEGMPEGYGPV